MLQAKDYSCQHSTHRVHRWVSILYLPGRKKPEEHGLEVLFNATLFTLWYKRYPVYLKLLSKPHSAWFPTEFYFYVAKANSKMLSTNQISTESQNLEKKKRYRKSASSSGKRERAHHWLHVSCPDTELILSIWKRLDGLEYLRKRCETTFVLGRSSESMWQQESLLQSLVFGPTLTVDWQHSLTH